MTIKSNPSTLKLTLILVSAMLTGSGCATPTNTCEDPTQCESSEETSPGNCTDGDTTTRGCGINSRGTLTSTCTDGVWTESSTCEDSDVCEDLTTREEEHDCGLNGRGTSISRCVNGQWMTTGICNDPDVCTNETETTSPCGKNGRGTLTFSCLLGQWTSAGQTCVDPDVCTDDDTRPGTSSCGLNANGVALDECYEGHWRASSLCEDPDICTNGETRTSTCGLLGNGMLVQTCTDGGWGTGTCQDPDVCGEPVLSTYIVGGYLECGYPAVGALMIDDIAFCTGTLIAEDAVLTAAHCIDAFKEYAATGQPFGFFLGLNANDVSTGTVVPVSAYHAHPQWTDLVTAAYPTTYDIGIVRLAEPAPVSPMEYQTTPMSDDIVGTDYTFVGYGKTAGSPNASSGVKMATTLAATELLGDGFKYSAEATNVCNGDSGGPAFINLDGTMTVAGVTSYGDQDCAEYGVSTRSDLYVDFIEEHLTASTKHTMEDPAADCGVTNSWLGDGYCDPSANKPACGFDAGDCCASTCLPGLFSCGSNGYDCRDPWAN